MKKILLIGIIFLLGIVSVFAVDNFGEVDGNGIINSLDVNNIYKYINFQPIDFSCNPLQADVDGDGGVTIADYNELKNYLAFQPYTFNGKPAAIEISSDDVIDNSNLKVGDVLNLYALVSDADGTPRACVGVDFISNNQLSINNGITDINGKIPLTVTLTQEGYAYLNSFMKGSPSKNINDINYTVEVMILPAVVIPVPVTPAPSSSGGGGGGNHDYTKTAIIPAVPAIPKVKPAIPAVPAQPNTNELTNTETGPTGAVVATPNSSNTKTAIAIGILVLGLIGAGIYYFKTK